MALNVVDKIDNPVKIEHALISVFDKKGLDELVPVLIAVNPAIRIYSTGNTFAVLQTVLGADWQKNLQQVAEYTGQPEMQGGLVKTLDFKIYLGLLGETYNEAHNKDLQRVRAVKFDLVVVNLYPFAQTIAKQDTTPETARANIDIGGPCMIRAAAKNYLRVAPVTDPGDYPKITAELKKTGGFLSFATRWELARKAFQHTAAYDTTIARYLAEQDLETVKKCYQFIK